MTCTKNKLPKSFWHWCKLASIHPSSHRSKIFQCWYAKGSFWRVLIWRSEFQLSIGGCNLFTRWKDKNVSKVPIPQSKDEFLNSVRKMIGDKNDLHKKANRN